MKELSRVLHKVKFANLNEDVIEENMTPEAFIKALHWPYAVKKFDSNRKIPPETWKSLEESLVLTPSSYGLQPWKFIVVQDPEIRKKLTPLSWNQTQVADCSHFVVFAVKEIDHDHLESYIQRVVEVRAVAPESMVNYRKMITKNILSLNSADTLNWASRQVYIALGSFMTSAAVLGIDTCPMEGLEPANYDEVLKLKGTNYHTLVACAAGYRSADDRNQKLGKVRFTHSGVVETL